LAGVVVTLVFLWMTNLALLLGAQINAELERGRQLQGGFSAERELQLPPRDTRNIEKAAEKDAEDQAEGRKIRRAAQQRMND
jgi:membrane protein